MCKMDDDRRVAVVVRVIHLELGWTGGDKGIFFSWPWDEERPHIRIRELRPFSLNTLHPFPANAFAPAPDRYAKCPLRAIPFDNPRVGKRDALDVCKRCHLR